MFPESNPTHQSSVHENDAAARTRVAEHALAHPGERLLPSVVAKRLNLPLEAVVGVLEGPEYVPAPEVLHGFDPTCEGWDPSRVDALAHGLHWLVRTVNDAEGTRALELYLLGPGGRDGLDLRGFENLPASVQEYVEREADALFAATMRAPSSGKA